MDIEQIELINGEKIQILEMVLTNKVDQLELTWRFFCDKLIFHITFYNVSRFRIENFSVPLEVYGLEIINHSQNCWERDSKYEIRDFEDNRVNFFCESFEIHT